MLVFLKVKKSVAVLEGYFQFQSSVLVSVAQYTYFSPADIADICIVNERQMASKPNVARHYPSWLVFM